MKHHWFYRIFWSLNESISPIAISILLKLINRVIKTSKQSTKPLLFHVLYFFVWINIFVSSQNRSSSEFFCYWFWLARIYAGQSYPWLDLSRCVAVCPYTKPTVLSTIWPRVSSYIQEFFLVWPSVSNLSYANRI